MAENNSKKKSFLDALAEGFKTKEDRFKVKKKRRRKRVGFLGSKDPESIKD